MALYGYVHEREMAALYAARVARMERIAADPLLCPNGSTCTVMGCVLSHPEIDHDDMDFVSCRGCGEISSYGEFMRSHVVSGRDCGVYV